MRKKEIKAKLDEIIDFSGVERYIDTPVKRYSSGMYVRLAFGVAAHLDPEILVIDEVLAVGDAEFQKKCIGKMQDVSRSEGRTVLFVSHNMAAVKSLCTQSIVLKNGMVDFEKGDTELAIQHYIRAEISASKILLRNRKDRSGRGRIQFTAVEYLNGAGEIVPSLISGEKAEIRAYYQNPEQFESINNKIEVSITHPEGIILIQFNNFLKNFPLKLNHKEGYVSVHIDRLPVSGGQYFINLLVFSNDLLEDWVIHAGSLLVEEGDYYGYGVSSTGIKADHTWEEN
jgi:lipopolysaccharide transport system ATP-binding protein